MRQHIDRSSNIKARFPQLHSEYAMRVTRGRQHDLVQEKTCSIVQATHELSNGVIGICHNEKLLVDNGLDFKNSTMTHL